MKSIWLGLASAFTALTLACGGGGTTPAPTPTPAPTITSLSASSGSVGAPITISGSHLTGTSAVKFNGTAATFTFVSDTQVTTAVPVGAASGAITLTTPGGTATSPTFTVTTAPGARTFWLNDLDAAGTWIEAPFLQAYQDSRCTVWVREADQNLITPALLEHYGAYFTQHSWPDVTGYVHRPTEFFGEAGDRINILFYKAGQDVAGYFWEKDFYSQADLNAAGYGSQYKSNETNVFYLNIDAAVSAANQANATLFTEGTLTHEFQHMCNAHYFWFDSVGSAKTREMDSWANELCSVTAESIFAGQLDIYIPSYKSNAKFKTGGSDFLQWRNDFTQYTAVSLMGSYLVSQIPDANRANFFKAFLSHTQTEGTAGTQVLTSVEDLLATIQDAQIGWTPSGWTPITNFATETTQVRDDWASVMKAFGTGLTGQNTVYSTYVASRSSQSVSPVCAASTGGNFVLKPSGFFIGKTNVASLGSLIITDASNETSGRSSAYAVVFNATLPSRDLLGSSSTLPTATAAVGTTQFVARTLNEEPEGKAMDFQTTFRYNRAMGFHRMETPLLQPTFRTVAAPAAKTNRATIPGAGDPANGGNATAGYNYCVYVAR